MFMPPKPNVEKKMKIQTSVATPSTNPIRTFFKRKMKAVRETISKALEPPRSVQHATRN